jgi:hypothetical protein
MIIPITKDRPKQPQQDWNSVDKTNILLAAGKMYRDLQDPQKALGEPKRQKEDPYTPLEPEGYLSKTMANMPLKKNIDWDKFEGEARPSTNIEDVRDKEEYYERKLTPLVSRRRE